MASLAEEDEKRFQENIIILEATFGGTVSSEMISSVLLSCDGDVNVAADTIMTSNSQMTQDEAAAEENENVIYENYTLFPISTTQTETITPSQLSITANPFFPKGPSAPTSFAEASRHTGAVPKVYSDTRIPKPQYKNSGLSDQIAKIIDYHCQGTRTLILMRGVAGSGKTYLAKCIVDYTVGVLPQNYALHIFSSDNFFMRGGKYQFYRSGLDDAHRVNQKKVCDAATKGLSPIIVDNTNTVMWEMEPYVRDGVRNGYIIEIVEPKTTWARNINELTKRNVHGVPRESIQRMLDRYEKSITVQDMMQCFRLSYPANKKPPMRRKVPEIDFRETCRKPVEKTVLSKVDFIKDDLCSTASGSKALTHSESTHSPDKLFDKLVINDTACTSQIIKTMPMTMMQSQDNDAKPEEVKFRKITKAQQNFTQFEAMEKEWESGGSWESGASNIVIASQDLSLASDPKPPRVAEKNDTVKLIEPVNICDDWTKISMFMPPWHDEEKLNSAINAETPTVIETQNASTCFESGDLNEKMYKILYGLSRNINATQNSNFPVEKTKLQKVGMLDTSTSTHENILIETGECKYKEHHFAALKRMFKTVPEHILRDIFDSCLGDVNWAVNIVLDSYPETLVNHDFSDTEDELIDGCQCLAAYRIIPDKLVTAPISPVPEIIPQGSAIPLVQKKTKRDNNISDSSLKIKRQIESNVMISDNHYSQHYLDTRRRRENFTGDLKIETSTNAKNKNMAETNTPLLYQLDTENAIALPEAVIPNKSHGIRDFLKPNSSHQFNSSDPSPIESDVESDGNKPDNVDQLISVDVGFEFITKLDALYGNEGFPYPDYLQPTLNLPKSILDDIYEYWSQSVTSQIDDGSKQSEAMIKQDEDFARELAAKEDQRIKEGTEPDVPTLKDIMKMEFAYSLSVIEWRKKEPQDFAAKLSRNKLHNLFPEMHPDLLSEMLMAHGYNFKDTIESLLGSTGQGQWLEIDKGIEKFVMHKELQRNQKFVAEQQRGLSTTEWPALLSNNGMPISLETVQKYRNQAQVYLAARNFNFEAARHYLNTHIHDAALIYSAIAAVQTKCYEQTSMIAAACLTHYHLRKNPDKHVLDLHFLYVPEAMVNMDIFLDQMILHLRTNFIHSKETWIITGKGAHSKCGPRIKPAAKKRLTVRQIKFSEANPGLLKAKVYAGNRTTHELGQC